MSQTGRIIPSLPNCPGSRPEALRYFRDTIGAALVQAQDALKNVEPLLTDTNDAIASAKQAVDRLLSANPDPTTPRSTDELTVALDNIGPTTDRELLEQAVGRLLDINIVNGYLFPKGTTDLSALRQLFKALALTADSCDLSGLDSAFGLGDDRFLLVAVRNDTVERVVESTCGDDIVEYEVVEIPIGLNVNVNDAAEQAGVDSNDINIKLFWIDEIRTDAPTIRRLRALGLTTEELGAALTNQSAGRVTTAIIDTSILGDLRNAGLTDEELCRLLGRDDTAAGINTAGTADDVLATIRSAINQNTGGSGLSGDGGRGGDPLLLLFGLIDLPRSLGIGRDEDGAFSLDGAAISTDGLSDECVDILSLITISLDSIEALMAAAQQFFRNLFSIGEANRELNAGISLASCLVSFNLGLDLSIELSLEMPFVLGVFVAAFAALLTGVIAAATALRAVVCLPQGVVQLLFGGICGFKPFDFDICPPDIEDLLQRLISMLNMILTLIQKIGSAMLTMQADVQSTLRSAVDLKGFSACSIPAAAIGVALDLLDPTQLSPAAASLLGV